MDRKIFYAGQIPLSAQFLQSDKNTMIGLAYLAEAVFGQQTITDGLICTGMTPASLTVQVGPGHIWQIANVDGSQYGSLFGDNAHSILKQGINLDAKTFTLVPPDVAGQSVDYLIQAALQETDADNIVLPYVNSENPQVPWTGPNNSGIAQPTTRKCIVALSAKSGVAATTGTQVAPVPDPGFVGLYVVTVPFGATTLDGNNIRQLDDAPFLFQKLPGLPRWVQSGEFLWGEDTGTANAIVTKLTPIPFEYKKGMHVFVRKMGAPNDSNVTFNGNQIGAVAVLDVTGAQIPSGNMTGNMVLHLVFDGTAFRWVNGNITNVEISSIAASSGQGITVSGASPFPVSLNFPGLAADTPTALDLFAFYDNEGTAHRVISYANLLALFLAQVSVPQLATVAPAFIVEQRRPNGGTIRQAPQGVWTRRPLSDVVVNQIASANLAGEQITLPAGTYRASFLGNLAKSGHHRTRLRNVTGNVTVGTGQSADSYVAGGNYPLVPSMGVGRFVLASPSLLELQTYAIGEGFMGDTEEQNIGSDYHVDGWVEIVKEA